MTTREQKAMDAITSAQVRFIDDLHDELGYERLTDHDIDVMTKEQASQLIDYLKRVRNERNVARREAERVQERARVTRDPEILDEPIMDEPEDPDFDPTTETRRLIAEDPYRDVPGLDKPKTGKVSIPLEWFEKLRTMISERQIMPMVGEVNRIIKEFEQRGLL